MTFSTDKTMYVGPMAVVALSPGNSLHLCEKRS